MSGGKSMKNNVIGSRRTVMNSLNRIAFSPRNGARFMASRRRVHSHAKLQAPSTKLQRSTKHQAPNRRSSFLTCLEFGISLELGAWSLELSPSRGFLLLILARMFRRQGNENVFERRTDLVDLGTLDPDAAQFLVDLLPSNRFVDEQVHGLTEHGRIQDSFHFAHRAQRHGDVIAGGIEAPRSGWTHLRHSFQIVGLTADDQLRVVNVADMRAALRLVHVMRGDEERHSLTREFEKQVP